MAIEKTPYQIVPWPGNPKKWSFIRHDLMLQVGPFDTQKQARVAARKELGMKP